MTNSPQTLLELATYWTSKGGVNLGIVGNSSHCAGYHLGRDRIYSSCACKPSGECVPGRGDKDYSVQQDRDKNSLTNYASAIDLGKINGSLVGLREFTAYLFERGLAGDPLMHDVREVIGSTDGVNVYGWSALAPDHLIKDYGDASHKEHTHISWWRDSELRSKLALFAAYFEGDDVTITLGKGEDWLPMAGVNGTSNGCFRKTPDVKAPIVKRVPIGTTIRSIAEVTTSAATDNNWRLTFDTDGTPLYMLRRDWMPVTQGGSDVVNAGLFAYISRATVKTFSDGVNAAIAAIQKLV